MSFILPRPEIEYNMTFGTKTIKNIIAFWWFATHLVIDCSISKLKTLLLWRNYEHSVGKCIDKIQKET